VRQDSKFKKGLSMRRHRILLVTIVALIVIAPAITVWAVSRVPDTEAPPCRSCAGVYASAEIPTVNVCQLSASPKQFSGKTVRVTAIFHHDAGQISLRNYDCGARVYVGLSPSCESCAGTQKALTMYTGYRTWYDSDANVTVVGKVGRIEGDNNFYRDYDGINVICLERVEPIGWSVFYRIYYTVGQVARRIFG
jgi:Fe-S cluster biogenesis protein NfuA